MANDLSSLLAEGVILNPQASESRKQILGKLADAVGEKLGLEGRDIFDAVIEREKLGSTSVGEGVAIPHARISGLEHPVGAFVRLHDGVDFDAIDGQPCDLPHRDEQALARTHSDPDPVVLKPLTMVTKSPHPASNRSGGAK